MTKNNSVKGMVLCVLLQLPSLPSAIQNGNNDIKTYQRSIIHQCTVNKTAFIFTFNCFFSRREAAAPCRLFSHVNYWSLLDI